MAAYRPSGCRFRKSKDRFLAFVQQAEERGVEELLPLLIGLISAMFLPIVNVAIGGS
jgi:hypothetical protein